jgi:Tol biopolymer transport system component
MRTRIGLAVATALVVAGGSAAMAQAAPNDTTLQGRETGSPGVKQNGSFVDTPVISADGRYIAFTANASNLGGGFTGIYVYLRDTQTNTTTLVSRADGLAGDPANTSAENPSISADGRFVAFQSQASNLGVANPLDNIRVYVRDTVDNTTTLVSRADGPAGDPPDADAVTAAISGDGGSVAFRSAATNLDDDATDGTQQVFVRDLTLNDTILASRADGSAGAPGDANSAGLAPPSLSGDGTFVAFDSFATNLDPDDSAGTASVFLRNVEGDTTSLVSRADGGSGANANGTAFDPSISADGDRIAFVSSATNLDAVDAESSTDIFVRDRSASDTLVASVSGLGPPGDGPDGHPAIAADGRAVVFESGSSNLYPGFDGNFDIAMRDIQAGQTSLLSRATGASGTIGDASSRRPSVSADGTRVAFYSEATNLDPDDTDPVSDVYMRETDIDVTAPTVSIDSAPSGRITDNTPTFEFSSTDDDVFVFQCFVDGVGDACNGPLGTHTTGPLDDGPHTFEVRAMDLVGNVGEETSASFTVDTTGPVVDLEASPARTADNTPSFSFSTGAADFDEFQCRVDVAPYESCTSPFTPPAPLADGEYSFVVRAFDDLGNDGGEVFRDFEIDTVGPAAEITEAPPATSTDTTPTVAFTSNAADLDSFECALDGGSFTACTSPSTFGPVGIGAHTIDVRALDDLGNQGAPQQASFTVNEATVPPGDTEVEGPVAVLPPKLTVKGKELKPVVTASADEPVGVASTATVVLDPKKGAEKRTALVPATADVPSGEAKLTFRYPGSKKKRQKSTKKLVKSLQGGARATLEVEVEFTDEAGNTAVVERSAKLKAKKKK